MERKMWTLLAIDAAGERGLSPVQLQKSLFLLGRTCPDNVGADFYQFVAYDYGPFDSGIYADARELEHEGAVIINPDYLTRWRIYRVTPLGVAQAQEAKVQVDSRTVRYLETVVKWAQGLGFSELVSAVYWAFPEYRVNSVFQS